MRPEETDATPPEAWVVEDVVNREMYMRESDMCTVSSYARLRMLNAPRNWNAVLHVKCGFVLFYALWLTFVMGFLVREIDLTESRASLVVQEVW